MFIIIILSGTWPQLPPSFFPPQLNISRYVQRHIYQMKAYPFKVICERSCLPCLSSRGPGGMEMPAEAWRDVELRSGAKGFICLASCMTGLGTISVHNPLNFYVFLCTP